MTVTWSCCVAASAFVKVFWSHTQVMRITPRLNESINEEWLSDKGRFSYDGLKCQRLNVPLVKTSEGFTTVLWPDALKAVAEGLNGVKGNEIKAVAGKLADAESMVALKASHEFCVAIAVMYDLFLLSIVVAPIAYYCL